MSQTSEPKRIPRSAELTEVVRRALAEDRADDDVTTQATVPSDRVGAAQLVAREPCVVAGLDVFCETFEHLGAHAEVLVRDGEGVGAGGVIATVAGPMRSILSGERTALNFVQRLSGIATLTRAFVDAAGRAAILDTRKTTPGLRTLEKAAVLAGGGRNHRRDLASAVLIKDNHLMVAGSVSAAVAASRAAGATEVQVECDTLEQVSEALDAGAERILLDNMDLETLRKAVALVDGRARTEASGGITLETVTSIAATGVDEISVGALTHSARAIDLSLEVV